ncbi:hypothetical protein KB559_13520 [Paenibacillus sp. Marseille-P2973]|uniref:hypothetical protein n=1 Tax=Paenibacillus sp. Marseille-P2973 TaxID=1871032 RepID=UPI001B372DA1|nr:hypothetical protein [Paenibacillus sp. Marseille-P2973]MBQ4899864.1 hypothetical protein [Paenibacillus sp. Marseille-P2973]
MLFKVEGVKKLKRQAQDVFLTTVTVQTLNSWNLPVIKSATISPNIILISYDTLVYHDRNEIEVTAPMLLFQKPQSDDADEYPVLFVANDRSLPKYCEERLLEYESFNRLIDQSKNLSSNSTKLMVYHSFKEILNRHLKISINRDQWSKLVTDLIDYIQTLLTSYPFLNYLPIKERKQFRKRSIADTSIAWEFYLVYFLEEWMIRLGPSQVPDLRKPFNYEGWTGDFFDRDNPFWQSYITSNGKFLFNEADRESIYRIWREWMRRA